MYGSREVESDSSFADVKLLETYGDFYGIAKHSENDVGTNFNTSDFPDNTVGKAGSPEPSSDSDADIALNLSSEKSRHSSASDANIPKLSTTQTTLTNYFSVVSRETRLENLRITNEKTKEHSAERRQNAEIAREKEKQIRHAAKLRKQKERERKRTREIAEGEQSPNGTKVNILCDREIQHSLELDLAKEEAHSSARYSTRFRWWITRINCHSFATQVDVRFRSRC